MADYSELLNAIKKAATEAVDARRPVHLCFGKVTNSSPLQILVDQKMTLGSSQLVLTRNVTDFKTKVTVDWITENKSGGSGEASFASHNHSVTGKKEITIHNALEKEEEVILFRMQGGQKYIVLDRIGDG